MAQFRFLLTRRCFLAHSVIPHMGGKNRKYNSLARRPPRYEPRKKVLIVCEGTVTEPEFFDFLSTSARTSLVDVEAIGLGGDPKYLVEKALERKRAAAKKAKREQFLAYDQVWCVCDVDDHGRLPDARQQARDNGIGLAVSNPSFELWALLHFEDHRAWIHRDDLKAKLRVYMPKYEKSLDMKAVLPGLATACARARALEARHKANGSDGNPSSDVYLLCDVILQKRP